MEKLDDAPFFFFSGKRRAMPARLVPVEIWRGKPKAQLARCWYEQAGSVGMQCRGLGGALGLGDEKADKELGRLELRLNVGFFSLRSLAMLLVTGQLAALGCCVLIHLCPSGPPQ